MLCVLLRSYCFKFGEGGSYAASMSAGQGIFFRMHRAFAIPHLVWPWLSVCGAFLTASPRKEEVFGNSKRNRLIKGQLAYILLEFSDDQGRTSQWRTRLDIIAASVIDSDVDSETRMDYPHLGCREAGRWKAWGFGRASRS